MVTKKTSKEEKFENQDFPLFDALAALDKKDYTFFDNLTIEQQRKFVPFMLVKYMSYLKGNSDLSAYYARSTDYHANRHLFNEYVQKHPKLQWLMLCASSPGLGKQFHPWLPQIKERVSQFREAATLKDTKEFYKKVYPKANDDAISEVAEAFVTEQKRKMYFAKVYPELKYEDIEILNGIISNEEIKQYERERGNL